MQDLSLWLASSLVVALGLSCPAASTILVPWPGIKPVSPTLQGRFLTPGPPEKSQRKLFCQEMEAVRYESQWPRGHRSWVSPDRLGSFPGGMEGLPEEGANLTKGRTTSWSPEASQKLLGRWKPGSVVSLLHTECQQWDSKVNIDFQLFSVILEFLEASVT